MRQPIAIATSIAIMIAFFGCGDGENHNVGEDPARFSNDSDDAEFLADLAFGRYFQFGSLAERLAIDAERTPCLTASTQGTTTTLSAACSIPESNFSASGEVDIDTAGGNFAFEFRDFLFKEDTGEGILVSGTLFRSDALTQAAITVEEDYVRQDSTLATRSYVVNAEFECSGSSCRYSDDSVAELDTVGGSFQVSGTLSNAPPFDLDVTLIGENSIRVQKANGCTTATLDAVVVYELCR